MEKDVKMDEYVLAELQEIYGMQKEFLDKLKAEHKFHFDAQNDALRSLSDTAMMIGESKLQILQSMTPGK